jgi:hypothetical protein
MKQEDIVKFGVVAMIDALGIRQATIDKALDFIETIEDIKESLPLYMEGYLDSETEEIKTYFKKVPPKITSFGDTLVVTWEILDRLQSEVVLINTSAMLSYIMASGLEKGFLFRGAISIGDYIIDSSHVLGPAVGDVASWYEMGEWFGIFATPYCCQFINQLEVAEQNRSKSTTHTPPSLVFYYMKYKVPLRDGHSHELWVVPWPAVIMSAFALDKDPLIWYYLQVQKGSIPKQTEEKYFQTEQFVKMIMTHDKFKT